MNYSTFMLLLGALISVQALDAPTPTLLSRDTPTFHIDAVSTNCAAVRRNQQAPGGSCVRTGHLTSDGNAHRALSGVTYQRCINECVCRPGSAPCGAIAFVPNNRGQGRGRCRLYQQHLDQLPFESGPAADGHTVDFADRSCYHKAVPSMTNTMTQNPRLAMMARAAPTAVPEKEDDLEDQVMSALAGL